MWKIVIARAIKPQESARGSSRSDKQDSGHRRAARGCVARWQRFCFGAPVDPGQIPSIFKPQSTPANSIFHLSLLVLAITGLIFAVVFTLLAYAVMKFRKRDDDDGREPPQVYGSNQVELAWTVIPTLIVLVLFLATARVIRAIQDAPKPPGAIEVIAIGHQFWWEFRYAASASSPRTSCMCRSAILRIQRPRFSLCFPLIPTTVFGCRGWPGRPT